MREDMKRSAAQTIIDSRIGISLALGKVIGLLPHNEVKFYVVMRLEAGAAAEPRWWTGT